MCSQPVANLIHQESDFLATLDSEKAELLRRKYCSVFIRDNGFSPECPQSVPCDSICNISVDNRNWDQPIPEILGQPIPGYIVCSTIFLPTIIYNFG